MNTPNPLIPQGSLLEQKAKGRPHLRVAYVIVAVHLVFLGGLLIQGCKKEDQSGARANAPTNDSALPPLDTANLYPTNAAAPPTNPTSQDLTAAPPATGLTTQSVPQPTLDALPAATREYIVVNGDTFSTIGKKLGVPWRVIAKANPGVDSTRLKIGQKLVVPAPAAPAITQAMAVNGAENVYVVKSGDTLLKIAKDHGATVSDIKTLNGLKTDLIKAGDKLKLPAARSAPATPTPATQTPAAPPPGTANL